MLKCTKIAVLCLILTFLFCPFANGKISRKSKNKPVVTTGAQPFEIDEEFKGEFEYFDAEAEKLKVKELKSTLKIEKKHQKLTNKKKKLEKKRQQSLDNIKNYTNYEDNLKNSFIPEKSSEN